ncbi:MAG: hypothetical protein ACLSH3_15725 [Alistipes finegoldii]
MTVDIANLRPEDIGVEMVIARRIVGGQGVNVTRTIRASEHARTDNNLVTYAFGLHTPNEAGTFDVALRIYPGNPRLPHRMDFCIGEMGIGFKRKRISKRCQFFQLQDCKPI